MICLCHCQNPYFQTQDIKINLSNTIKKFHCKTMCRIEIYLLSRFNTLEIKLDGAAGSTKDPSAIIENEPRQWSWRTSGWGPNKKKKKKQVTGGQGENASDAKFPAKCHRHTGNKLLIATFCRLLLCVPDLVP